MTWSDLKKGGQETEVGADFGVAVALRNGKVALALFQAKRAEAMSATVDQDAGKSKEKQIARFVAFEAKIMSELGLGAPDLQDPLMHGFCHYVFWHAPGNDGVLAPTVRAARDIKSSLTGNYKTNPTVRAGDFATMLSLYLPEERRSGKRFGIVIDRQQGKKILSECPPKHFIGISPSSTVFGLDYWHDFTGEAYTLGYDCSGTDGWEPFPPGFGQEPNQNGPAPRPNTSLLGGGEVQTEYAETNFSYPQRSMEEIEEMVEDDGQEVHAGFPEFT